MMGPPHVQVENLHLLVVQTTTRASYNRSKTNNISIHSKVENLLSLHTYNYQLPHIYNYHHKQPLHIQPPDTTTTTLHTLHKCKWSILAPLVRRKEIHHQCKLQARASISWSGMHEKRATATITTTDQIRTSMGTVGVADAAVDVISNSLLHQYCTAKNGY